MGIQAILPFISSLAVVDVVALVPPPASPFSLIPIPITSTHGTVRWRTVPACPPPTAGNRRRGCGAEGRAAARHHSRSRPTSAAFRDGLSLRSSVGPDGGTPEEGEGDQDNLLGEQASQALEFWKYRKPTPSLPPTQVIGLLMAALQKNDSPMENDGLRTVFDFSSGMCRMAVGGTAETFINGARNSVFGATVNCQSFFLDPMQLVSDRFATQVVSVIASDGRRRRFLWTLERQRRPPDAGKWLIYGVISSDVDGALTMEG